METCDEQPNHVFIVQDRHPLGQNHRDHAKFKRNLQVRSAAKRRQVHAAPPEARRCAKRYPRFAL